MAHGLPDYAKGVQIQYDPNAYVTHGPELPLHDATEKSVDNTEAVRILQSKGKRVGLCIQAKADNTGIVYLGFGFNVSTTIWFAELQAGMAFCDNTWCGDIWARADVAAAQKLGCADW